MPKVAHEWIGGVLAFTPTDLDFDDVNGFLWIAEKESLHRLTRDKVYWRYGYVPITTPVTIHHLS